MNNATRFFFILLVGVGFTHAQVVRHHEKVRFGFGVSAFTSDQINQLLRGIEQVTLENGLLLPVSDFDDHVTWYLEYESNFWNRYSYLISMQYHQETVNGFSDNLLNQISQQLSYKIILIEGSASLVRNFPLKTFQQGSLDLVVGAGVDLVYAHADLSYFYQQLPVVSQQIEFLRSGIILGARIFLGLQVPVIPSLLLQLRSGYSMIPEKELAGNVKSSNLEKPVGAMEPIDPGVFIENNSYALSQLWITFGMAYCF